MWFSARRIASAFAIMGALLLSPPFLAPPSPANAAGAAASGADVASAELLGAQAPRDPVAACAGLVAAPVEQLKDAPTRVQTAEIVAAGGGLPEYCRVIGYVAPQIQFELRLPAKGWNGDYYQTGCGGLCGNVPIRSCDTALSRNFAVAAENSGHAAASHDALWAFGDPSAKVDYGYRSPHVVSIAGKALTEAFYGKPAKLAFFQGCSNGGRQGISLATRYPKDFNGIIVRDPALHGPQAGMYFIWVSTVNHRADGTVILPAERLPLVHKAVLAACDGLDGHVDGVLDDPRKCRWDPSAIACAKGQAADTCLTSEQVKVVEQYYGGPTDSRGRELYPVNSELRGLQVGALARGSELEWANPAFDLISSTPGRPSVTDQLASGFYRYLLFKRDRGPGGDYRDFDFDRDPARLDNDYIGTGSVDLRAFRRAGGRLLLIQDFADQAIPASSTIAYYEEAVERNGGGSATGGWLRLFMVPGTPHCGNGATAPGVIDSLQPMVDWVERDTPPETLLARQLDASGKEVAQRTLEPYKPATR